MADASIQSIKETIRTFKKPADFTLVTVKAFDGAIWLCIYENEIMSFPYDVRESVYVFLERIRTELQKGGLRVELIGRPGDPPRR